MDFINETARLIIKDAHPEDTGPYHCEIWNEVGQTESSFNVTIKEQKGKPKRTRAQRSSVPEIQVPEDKPAVYEPEGPKKAPKPKTSVADRKISKISNNLEMIDESGSKYDFI